MGVLTNSLLKVGKLVLSADRFKDFETRLRDYNTVKYIKAQRSTAESGIHHFDIHKCIFIHIPKTGGTSIASALFGSNVGHYKWSLLKNAFDKDYDNYFKFAFVRNPWDRLLSAFNYLQSDRKTKANAEWMKQNRLEGMDFETFVTTRLEDLMYYPHFKPQSDFICDYDGKIMVDYLGKFNELDVSFKFIMKKLNIQLDLPHYNKSSSKEHYSKAYNEAMLKVVNRVYRRDIDIFKYKYEQ